MDSGIAEIGYVDTLFAAVKLPLLAALYDAVTGAKLGAVLLQLIYAVLIIIMGTILDGISTMLIIFVPSLATIRLP